MLMAFVLAMLMVAPTASVATVSGPQTVMQLNWRAAYYMFGDSAVLTDPDNIYDDSCGPQTNPPTEPCVWTVVTGGAITQPVSYSPEVRELTPENPVLVYRWHAGMTYVIDSSKSVATYKYDYGTGTDILVANIWVGSLDFSEKISRGSNSVTDVVTAVGMNNQFVITQNPTQVMKDNGAFSIGGGWWEIGFSIYVYNIAPLPTATEFWAAAKTLSM